MKINKGFIIETMSFDDWPEVRSIYSKGITTENATFESDIPEWAAWDANHLEHCRFVARSKGLVVGWAALAKVSNRRVYSGVAEVSIYVDPLYHGHGVGSALLLELIHESEINSIWTLQAGIFPENQSSIRLHTRLGFREVGRRERIGKMAYGKFEGKWRDVILMERRSKKIV